jgi:hypothetical protein
MEQIMKRISILLGKPEGKTPLERPRRSGKDSIKMVLKETVFEVLG